MYIYICMFHYYGIYSGLDKYTKYHVYVNKTKKTTSAAQGGGGSFKNRKPLREVGCCDSRMAERIH
jgi:hypothetical protein